MKPADMTRALTKIASVTSKADLYLCRAGFRLVTTEAAHVDGYPTEVALTYERRTSGVRVVFVGGGWQYRVDTDGDTTATAKHASARDGWPMFATHIRRGLV